MPRTRLQFLRRFTTRVVNPITRHFVGWLPGFANVHYLGRTSRRAYRTPMSVFRDGEDYVFALTYSADVQWVKNVVAAGACELEQRGRLVRLVDPRVIIDPTRRLMPQPVRFFLGLMGVSEFLRMRPAPERR
jgi:deazaflavin-dependent oxidoreductase (nitroreductase family)